jgi:capsular polysaccharide biosynthesis protein
LIFQETDTDDKNNFKLHLIILLNGRINLEPWAIITKDDKLLFGESSCYGPYPAEHWIFRTIKLPKPIHLTGKTLFISSRTNYWHLIANELCNLVALELSGIEVNHFDHIIFEKHTDKGGDDLHKIFSLQQHKQISISKNKHFICDELNFFSSPASLSKTLICAVKQKILSSFKYVDTNPTFSYPKRIAISRVSSSTRRWINEGECMQLLSSQGFHSVILENMNLLDQINIFRNADIILGPHGAGFTNLIFASPTTKIVEIRSEKQGGDYSSATCYEELSSILEIEHHVFHCPSIERKDLKGRAIEDADLVPDPEKLKNFVFEKVFI